jgi:hypothetical protein
MYGRAASRGREVHSAPSFGITQEKGGNFVECGLLRPELTYPLPLRCLEMCLGLDGCLIAR